MNGPIDFNADADTNNDADGDDDVTVIFLLVIQLFDLQFLL